MKRKILIVEDNVGLSQMQKDWFSQAGYEAVTAMNESIARSLIRKTQFDLILSDVRLPEGDGISLLEWLRKERKDIPFIITTEYVSVPDVVRTIKLGAIDYLPAQAGTQRTSVGTGRGCIPTDGYRTEAGKETFPPDKPQDPASGEIRQTGRPIGDVRNGTWCQRYGQGVGGAEHPSGQ